MAYAMTVLSWGGIAYPEGYTNSGQTNYLLAAVKWGTDFFIKAHVSPNVLYGQVNNYFFYSHPTRSYAKTNDQSLEFYVTRYFVILDAFLINSIKYQKILLFTVLKIGKIMEI